MIDAHPTFAPTIGEFKILCRGVEPSRRPEHKLLPHKPPIYAAADIANRELARMRRTLGANETTKVPRETYHKDI